MRSGSSRRVRAGGTRFEPVATVKGSKATRPGNALRAVSTLEQASFQPAEQDAKMRVSRGEPRFHWHQPDQYRALRKISGFGRSWRLHRFGRTFPDNSCIEPDRSQWADRQVG